MEPLFFAVPPQLFISPLPALSSKKIKAKRKNKKQKSWRKLPLAKGARRRKTQGGGGEIVASIYSTV